MFIWYGESYFRKSEKRGVIARELVESWRERGGGNVWCFPGGGDRLSAVSTLSMVSKRLKHLLTLFVCRWPINRFLIFSKPGK